MKHILLVEDDAWLGDMYEHGLRHSNSVKVYRALSADQALDILDSAAIDLIVLDMFLGEFNGVELLHEIRSYSDTRSIPVIVLSAVHAHDFATSAARWREYSVVEYLYKPSTKPEDLAATVRKYFAEASV